MPDEMNAVVIHEHGDVNRLSFEQVAKPKVAADEILLNIKAAALNHLDLWVRAGLPNLKIEMPHILGSDAAGVVTEVGDLVHNVKVGESVLLAPGWGCNTCAACLHGDDNLCRKYKILGESTAGTYAEYVKAPARNALPVPDGLAFEEAAAIPLVFLTAWHMLVTQVEIKPGDKILILGAGSGVGSAAIQIAKLHGADVIATASGKRKLSRATALGADDVIDHSTHDFAAEVKRLTAGRGVDVVFEHVGRATWQKSIQAVRKGGKIVTCGATTGYDAITDLRYVFFKELKIFGNFMGRMADLQEALKFFPAHLRPVVDKTFPLKEAAAAHSYVGNREQFGKVILVP